jgi:predicted anti-sigma-YlaC factor YlaD
MKHTGGGNMFSYHYTPGQLTTSIDGEMDTVYGEGAEVLLDTHLSVCEECAERMLEEWETANIVRRHLEPFPYVRIREQSPEYKRECRERYEWREKWWKGETTEDRRLGRMYLWWEDQIIEGEIT